jgi:hypothetical protein
MVISFLHPSLAAWGTPDFSATLKQDLEQLNADHLPLQSGLSRSSYVQDEPITALISAVSEEPGFIHARAGIFYTGGIAGCSCSDDPTPGESQNEYCEVLVIIDKATAQASFTLLAE